MGANFTFRFGWGSRRAFVRAIDFQKGGKTYLRILGRGYRGPKKINDLGGNTGVQKDSEDQAKKHTPRRGERVEQERRHLRGRSGVSKERHGGGGRRERTLQEEGGQEHCRAKKKKKKISLDTGNVQPESRKKGEKESAKKGNTSGLRKRAVFPNFTQGQNSERSRSIPEGGNREKLAQERNP